MALIRTVLVATTLVLVGLIVWAGMQANLFESFGPIAANPWGLVSLVDLYAGFLAAAVLVWLLESDRRIALAVIVPLFFLGNPLLLVWLAWRLPVIARRLADRTGN